MKIKKRQANTEGDPLLQFRISGCNSFIEQRGRSVLAQEERAAALVGGERHRGSGSSKFRKSDASSVDYQLECKQTVKESMRLNLQWLEKVCQEAEGKGKEPLLHIRFLAAEAHVGQDWVLMRSSEFERLLDAKHS